MISRYQFLTILVKGLLGLSGLLGLTGLLRFLGYKPPPPPPKRFELGTEKNYPRGSHTVLANVPALLVRKTEGPIAISMVCTHLGCTVEYTGEGFSCHCHGSRYSEDGQVTHGPAIAPLPTLAVERTAEGQLVILKD